MSQASDEELLARQSAEQEEAREVLAELDLAALVADFGQLLFAPVCIWVDVLARARCDGARWR
jgi:hypothetical protein